MPTIDLRFVSGGGVDSRIIKYTTRCRWSHVEVINSTRDLTFGAQLFGGVRWRSINDPCYRHALAYQIVQIDVTEQQDSEFWGFMSKQNGKPYDWRAIVSFAMGERDWRAEDAWFCSELDTRGLETVNIITLPSDAPANRISPRDLWYALAGKYWQPNVLLSLELPKTILVSTGPPVNFGEVVKLT